MDPGVDYQFFTIVARNYLAHAFVLGDSLRAHHPDARFSIFLMDDPAHEYQAVIESRGFRVIYPEQIPLAHYRQFVFKYNITEASTGVKPFVFQALLEQGPEKVIYLDPDILCLAPFLEVLNALSSFAIVLTPHICSPVPKDYFPDDREFLGSGVYNLGFIALRKSVTAARFVEWWADHLKSECLLERDAGLFVDQKWIDLVPGCFDSVLIMRNPGHNVAYWNLHERYLEQDEAVYRERNSGQRVSFFHFSGFDPADLDSIYKYHIKNPFSPARSKKRLTLRERPDLLPLFQRYLQLLQMQNVKTFAAIPYAYATYNNGDLISSLERSLYLSTDDWSQSDQDPFRVGPNSFNEVCRQSGIRALTHIVHDQPKLTTVQPRIVQLIQWVLRCCQRYLGTSCYMAFAKYMRHQLLPQNQAFLLKRRLDIPVGAAKAHVRASTGSAELQRTTVE